MFRFLCKKRANGIASTCIAKYPFGDFGARNRQFKNVERVTVAENDYLYFSYTFRDMDSF